LERLRVQNPAEILELTLDYLKKHALGNKKDLPAEVVKQINEYLSANPSMLAIQLARIIELSGKNGGNGEAAKRASAVAMILKTSLTRGMSGSGLPEGKRSELAVALMELLQHKLEGKAQDVDLGETNFF
jgi:hypothetical protein